MWQFHEPLKPGLERTVHAEPVARIVRSNPLANFLFFFYKNNLTQFYST